MKTEPRERPSEHEAIAATAAAWLAQRDDGLTPDEEREFLRWRGADVRHESAVLRLEAAWRALQGLREFRPDARTHPDADLLATRTRRGVSRRAVALAAAAAVCVLGALGWGTARWTAEHAAHVYTTTVDGYERVTLRDGSLLELNSSSEARVRYTESERRVQLVRGEAHFTVAKNPARPFWVEAGSVAVRAVGTAFNVRLDARDVEVLVTEGRVAVQTHDVRRRMEDGGRTAEAGGQRADGSTGSSSVVGRPSSEIAAGYRVTVSLEARTSGNVEKLEPSAIREALAWQGPRLTFLDTPLSVVATQFNRRNHVQLVVGEAELESLPIGGSFRAENLEGFVRLLELSSDIAVERPDDTHIVLRRKR
jgi:transmembrane sensor